ncbi:MAG TPA: hypothetical protein VFV10_08010 [Gammaproteobacteria bacterium]|nr:hypothetical protein [Gammaproteobacteria bacterium]
MRHFWSIAAFGLALVGPWASAQETGTPQPAAADEAAGPLEVTITLIPEDADRPAAVTKTLELPRKATGAYIASQQGVEHSASGLTRANLARDDRRAFGTTVAEAARESAEARSEGRDAAEQAREVGRGLAEAAAAAAQENREDLRGGSEPDRGDVTPAPPAVVPDRPEPPVSPARP